VAGKDRQGWRLSWINEVDVVDIFVSVEFHDCTVELNMVSDSVVRIESDCNYHGGSFCRFGYPGLHVLWYKYKVRLRVCANASSCDSGACIQIEATWRTGKLDMKRDDTVEKVWLDGIYSCILLGNLVRGLVNEHWSEVLDLADALIRSRREVDFSGFGTWKKSAWVRRLLLSVYLLAPLEGR
jgi:hypothetical protein